MKRVALPVAGIGILTLTWMSPAWGYKVTEVKNGGQVTGTIWFEGKAPAPKKLPITRHRNGCGTEPRLSEEFVVSKDGTLANVVLSLVGIESGKAFRKKAPRIVQKDCLFFPRVSLIPVDRRIVLINDDKILHNFRTHSRKNRSLNIAHPKYKRRLRIKRKFSVPEVMRLTCDVHPWMTGWVIAIDHPYHAVSEKSGKFALKNIPPGKYKLQAWHEELGTQVQTINVPAAGAVKADFRFRR